MAARAVVRAPSNIALIKYWGKADEDLIIPLNSSLSLTTDITEIYTETEVESSPDLSGVSLTLNGVSSPPTKRMLRVIEEVRKMLPLDKRVWGVRVSSYNNFPTAAGMASSASGFAALTYALVQAFGVAEAFPGQLSAIARLGSGSASRSLYGGFVEWSHGASHESSIALPLFPQSHWPDLELILVLISTASKEVSSTAGMRSSAESSRNLRERVERRVPERLERLKVAIRDRDFQTLAEITMVDSDDFHHICATSDPPIVYLTDKSRAIQSRVRLLNSTGEFKVAYTFDAGPNAFLVTLRTHRESVLRSLLSLCRVQSYSAGLNRQAQESIPHSLYEELAKTAEMDVHSVLSLAVSSRGPYRVDE